jgi:hypothetical protein
MQSDALVTQRTTQLLVRADIFCFDAATSTSRPLTFPPQPRRSLRAIAGQQNPQAIAAV